MNLNFELKNALNNLKGDTKFQPLKKTLGKVIESYFSDRQISKEKSLGLRNELLTGSGYIMQVMKLHQEYNGIKTFKFLPGLIGKEVKNDPVLIFQQNKYGNAGIKTVIALALILKNKVEKYADNIVQIAFGIDEINTTIRLDLLGNWGNINDITNFIFDFPPDLPNFDQFSSLICFGTLLQALQELGEASMSQPWEWSPGVIKEINPDYGCDNSIIEITGTGFGSTQEPGLQLLFTAYQGGYIEAKVISWSDTLIRVMVPPGVGDGPVGFIMPGSGGTTFSSALDTLMGSADMCLGMGATRVVTTLDRLSGTEKMVTITPTPSNIFHGGPPVIISFTGNACSTPVLIRPNQPLVLTWDVKNAKSVKITKTGPPELPDVRLKRMSTSGSVSFTKIQGTVSWTGTYLLEATNACGTVQMKLDVEMKERLALVLGGGGSKGDFEVGAVRCLYDVFGINPEIICGSSAGGLNASKLAEGKQALNDLESMWFSLMGPADMFVPTHTVQLLMNEMAIAGFLSKGLQFELTELLGIQFQASSGPLSPDAELAVASTKSVLGLIIGSGLIFTITDCFYNGLKFLLALGKIIDALKRLIDIERSLFLFDPVRAKLNALVDPAKVRNSGIVLRLSVTDLDTGKTRYVNESGSFTDNNLQDTPFDFLDAVQASASLPLVYPPVALSQGNYVDGGLKENIAIKSAELAGASSIIAIMASRVGVDEGDYTSSPLLPLLGRNLELYMDENQDNDIFPYRGFLSPVKIIAPLSEVHSLVTIDPGLIRINYDYGYNRAYDEFQTNDGIRSILRLLSDEIAQKRAAIWRLEHYAEGQLLPENGGFVLVGLQRSTSSEAVQMVRDEKRNLRAFYEQRYKLTGDRNSFQKGIEIAWQQWEAHRWNPIINTPWDDTSNHAGTSLPNEVPPANL